jgi:hypothetical protein
VSPRLAVAVAVLAAARPAAAAPDARAATSTPPAPLACLARYYAVQPRQHDGAWFARLPDGQEIPYDDGRAKTFEEKLAAPDIEDMFSIPYRTGPIQPVTREDDDPGRIRVDPIFAATYGARRADVDVVTIHFLDQDLRVHRRAVPAFQRVAARLDAALTQDPSLRPYLRKLGGTFVWRPIAGTDRQSAHSYGVSVDINVKLSHYWRWQKPPAPLRWQNQIPEAIVRAFEAEGFIWGGRWKHYDTMHFEYRPELLDPACAP